MLQLSWTSATQRVHCRAIARRRHRLLCPSLQSLALAVVADMGASAQQLLRGLQLLSGSQMRIMRVRMMVELILRRVLRMMDACNC